MRISLQLIKINVKKKKKESGGKIKQSLHRQREVQAEDNSIRRTTVVGMWR